MKVSYLFYIILSHLNYIKTNIHFENIKIPQIQIYKIKIKLKIISYQK